MTNTIQNGFDRNNELDKALAVMTTRELDDILLKLRKREDEETIKSKSPTTPTHNHIVLWNTPAGRAFSIRAQATLATHSRLPIVDKTFLQSVVMRAITLNEDNVEHLRSLLNKYKTVPTSGDKELDAKIWAKIHNREVVKI